MKNFFIKDSTLKVLSFIIAVVLWFYVILVIDPSVDVTIKNIPLRYINQSVLEERGLSLVEDPDLTVELKIRGSRKKIANIDNKNIYATVDLANMTKVGNFTIPISISVPYEYEEIVNKKPNTANIFIDKIVTAERNIKVETHGSVAGGYVAGMPETSVDTITLKGASTLVDRIKGVGVTLDFDSRTGEINDREKVYFIDADGNRIDEKDSIYQAVKIDVDTVEIKCPVLKVKTVPVEISPVPGVEYRVQPSKVTIYADSKVIDSITKITASVDVNALMSEGVQQAILNIPEGVQMADGITTVTVWAEKIE